MDIERWDSRTDKRDCAKKNYTEIITGKFRHIRRNTWQNAALKKVACEKKLKIE